MLVPRFRRAAIAAVAIASLAVAVTPAEGSATSARYPASVRSYDHHLLKHTNQARRSHHVGQLRMNRRLWTIAHAWAEHLARTHHLKHNPRLVAQISKQCPSWTAIGENIGVVYTNRPGDLFHAYLHSPEHRANILDTQYTQAGIATIKVHRHGQVQQWDVMDFGNHCPT